jgi:hypothetical protein
VNNVCIVNLKFRLSEEIELEEDYDFFLVLDVSGNVMDWFGS